MLISKAQQHRTRELNRQDAYERLRAILEAAPLNPCCAKPRDPATHPACADGKTKPNAVASSGREAVGGDELQSDANLKLL